jgi:hypothetical protein
MSAGGGASFIAWLIGFKQAGQERRYSFLIFHRMHRVMADMRAVLENARGYIKSPAPALLYQILQHAIVCDSIHTAKDIQTVWSRVVVFQGCKISARKMRWMAAVLERSRPRKADLTDLRHPNHTGAKTANSDLAVQKAKRRRIGFLIDSVSARPPAVGDNQAGALSKMEAQSCTLENCFVVVGLRCSSSHRSISASWTKHPPLEKYIKMTGLSGNSDCGATIYNEHGVTFQRKMSGSCTHLQRLKCALGHSSNAFARKENCWSGHRHTQNCWHSN